MQVPVSVSLRRGNGDLRQEDTSPIVIAVVLGGEWLATCKTLAITF
jgi:hypothetical protein